MAEYIDREALLANLKKQYGEDLGWQCTVNMSDVGMMIEDAPAADVAPRAEVESIFDELIKVSGEIAESYKKEADNMSCSDFARTEYRGTQIGALLVQYKIAELKKKYTGGKAG